MQRERKANPPKYRPAQSGGSSCGIVTRHKVLILKHMSKSHRNFIHLDLTINEPTQLLYHRRQIIKRPKPEISGEKVTFSDMPTGLPVWLPKSRSVWIREIKMSVWLSRTVYWPHRMWFKHWSGSRLPRRYVGLAVTNSLADGRGDTDGSIDQTECSSTSKQVEIVQKNYFRRGRALLRSPRRWYGDGTEHENSDPFIKILILNTTTSRSREILSPVSQGMEAGREVEEKGRECREKEFGPQERLSQLFKPL